MRLENRVGLVAGVANAALIAAGRAAAFAREGADLVLTCQNDDARPHVRPVAGSVGAAQPVIVPDQIDAVFDRIATRWERLDFLLHFVAFCRQNDLHGVSGVTGTITHIDGGRHVRF